MNNEIAEDGGEWPAEWQLPFYLYRFLLTVTKQNKKTDKCNVKSVLPQDKQYVKYLRMQELM